MDEEVIANAEAYFTRHSLRVVERLGFGIHGMVFLVEGNAEVLVSAVKILHEREPYRRERDIYERLAELAVTEIGGFEIPRLLRADDDLMALEMTVVTAPYVLDFAGAWLDFPPEFPEEVWQDWNRKNEEQFGTDWPAAKAILNELEERHIFMLDPSPSNICFR
jgi:hypothetical protein